MISVRRLLSLAPKSRSIFCMRFSFPMRFCRVWSTSSAQGLKQVLVKSSSELAMARNARCMFVSDLPLLSFANLAHLAHSLKVVIVRTVSMVPKAKEAALSFVSWALAAFSRSLISAVVICCQLARQSPMSADPDPAICRATLARFFFADIIALCWSAHACKAICTNMLPWPDMANFMMDCRDAAPAARSRRAATSSLKNCIQCTITSFVIASSDSKAMRAMTALALELAACLRSLCSSETLSRSLFKAHSVPSSRSSIFSFICLSSLKIGVAAVHAKKASEIM
mmetsp:Transcript_26218/g.47275  ORF Transcript_26218/g.47275 Transcript_26218/m.47275 type:complete len:284 (+) Transcript_26218:749-1600(+)